MKPFHKHGGLDKYDAYMPNKASWIQDNYYVSGYSSYFHLSAAYGYRDRGNGWNMGTQKKMWKASGRGIMIDGNSVGKSDES